MGRGRVVGVTLAMTVAVVAIASACSGEERVTSDASSSTVGTPGGAAGALSTTLAGTGRFTVWMSYGGAELEPVYDGEFAGDSLAVAQPGTFGMPGTNGQSLVVGDRLFVDAETWGASRLPEGIEWIELGDWPDAPSAAWVPVLRAIHGLGERLRGAAAAEADGTESLDGVTFQRYRAELPGSTFLELLGVPTEPGPGRSEAAIARDLWIWNHLAVEATLLEREGRIERLDLAFRREIPAEFRDCEELTLEAYPERMRLELKDLGADIRIDAPEPSTVTPLDGLAPDGGPSESEASAGGDTDTGDAGASSTASTTPGCPF